MSRASPAHGDGGGNEGALAKETGMVILRWPGAEVSAATVYVFPGGATKSFGNRTLSSNSLPAVISRMLTMLPGASQVGLVTVIGSGD